MLLISLTSELDGAFCKKTKYQFLVRTVVPG